MVFFMARERRGEKDSRGKWTFVRGTRTCLDVLLNDVSRDGGWRVTWTCDTFNINKMLMNRRPAPCSHGGRGLTVILWIEFNMFSSLSLNQTQQWLTPCCPWVKTGRPNHFDNWIIFISPYQMDTDIYMCHKRWALSQQHSITCSSVISLQSKSKTCFFFCGNALYPRLKIVLPT